MPVETADPFAQGAVWSGKRFFVLPRGVKPEDLQLTVTDRDGMKFKGELTLLRPEGNDDTYKVEGVATNKSAGPIDFRTEKKGFFQLRFQGRLSNAGLALEWGGSSFVNGSRVSGTASLKPKN